MQKHVNRDDVNGYSTQDLIIFLMEELGCESIQGSTCITERGQIQSVHAEVGNESISMFIVKNEEEFLSVLGLGEETSND